MKILFYDTKSYDQKSFETTRNAYPEIEIEYLKSDLEPRTAALADGFDAVCAFVSSDVGTQTLEILHTKGVKLILLRSAGYNNVDFKEAYGKVHIVRVPAYSPYAIAEFTMGLFLSLNRKLHRAYNRIREYNFSLVGLVGTDFHGKTMGVVGTGKIGQSMIRILKGFNMKILAYDPYPAEGLDVEYVSMEELVKEADLITLHCPLTSSTRHLINKRTIELMKKDVYLINTSRGALINTDDLIDALLDKKFAGVALDVYEEEEGLFYEDRSNDIIRDDNLARLMTFPNVMVTSHMGFFTKEAMEAIARVTLENAISVEKGEKSPNRVEAE